MITNLGKVHIKRFLAGWEPDLARSIAFGVGDSNEVATQDRLDYEIGRTDISLITYNYIEDKLVFKGVMDETFDGVIYEVALYSSEAGPASTVGSRLLLSFDSETEFWTQGGLPATYGTTNTRIGNDAMMISLNASTSATATYSDIFIDLSGYTSADTFSFAFHSAWPNVSSIVYRFYTDALNYYSVTVPGGSIGTGFNIVNIPVAQAVPTGVPRWSEITKVDVVATANADGAVLLQMEGVRVEDRDNTDIGQIMIARTKLATPFTKVAGTIQEVEFPLGVLI